MLTVLISGGTGLIGKQLSKKLQEKDFTVNILTTEKEKVNGLTIFSWNPEQKEISKKAIEEADYIIHLAGENIGNKKWSNEQKKLIIDSRVKSAALLFESVKLYNKNLKAFISASAVGYYGAITSEKIFSESDPPANDFLGEVCKQWEQAADRFNELGIRTVKLRTGLVLTKQNGALEKMVGPVKFRVGASLGDGKQYLPWIHIDDLCNIYIKAIEDAEMKGAYNAVAPEHVNNKEFMILLSKVLKKPSLLANVPAFVLKLMLGEMSELVLKGSRVSSEKIIWAGFKFRYKDLDSALKELFGEKPL